MMNELKLIHNIFANFLLTIFFNIIVLLFGTFGIVMTYLFENARDFSNIFMIFFIIILSFWLIFLLLFAFHKNIIVTNEEIKLCRNKKIFWIIKKADIQECIYQEVKWWNFIFPISAINMCALQFKLTNGVISRKYLSLSKKQVRKIQENFDYSIRIINSIYKQ